MNFGADIVTVRRAEGLLSGKMVFVLASLIFTMGLFFLFILQEYRNMKILTMEERIKSENLDKRRQTLAKMKSFERRVENLSKDEIARIENFIPSDDKIEFELSNLDISARVAEAAIKNMEIEKTENAVKIKKQDEPVLKFRSGNVEKVRFSFDVAGKYFNIKNFIASIEQDIPLMTFKGLTLKVEEEEDVKKDIEPAKINKQLIATINIEAYYYQSNQNK